MGAFHLGLLQNCVKNINRAQLPAELRLELRLALKSLFQGLYGVVSGNLADPERKLMMKKRLSPIQQ